MIKSYFCIYENKDADQQVCSNCTADQRLCFRYKDSTIPPLLNPTPPPPQKKIIIKILALFCGCIGRFASDLAGIPEDRFSRVAAQTTGAADDNMLRVIYKEQC